LGQAIAPTDISSPGLYVMLGMCAMMGAVLQAPLAALMTVLELTANPNIILPAMLIIVVATLVTSEVFKKESVFLTTLKTLGLEYPLSPLTLHLQRAAVASIMQRDFVRMPELTTLRDVTAALRRRPRWIVVEESSNEAHCLLNPTDLHAYVTDLVAAAEDVSQDGDQLPESSEIQLLKIPGQREDVVNIDIRATLAEALEQLNNSDAQALCVRRTSIPLVAPIMGVLTRADINNYRSN
jgi:CIC family chloride channel protein